MLPARTTLIMHVPESTATGSEATTVPKPPGGGSSKRMSLVQVLQSREVKDLVRKSVIVKKFVGPYTSRSSVMDHWVKTSMLRNQDDDQAEEETEEDVCPHALSCFGLATNC